MKLIEVFRFELTYQLKSISTWIYLSIGFLFPLFLSSIAENTDGEVYANAPSFLILITVFTSVILLFSTGAFAGDAASRDVQTGMYPLLYTAPIRKMDFFAGRVLASFLLHAVAHLGIPFGFILSFYIKNTDPELLAPFRLAPYISTYFFLSLPLAFVATLCQFSAAVLSRRTITAFLVSVLLFPIISLFISTTIGNLTGNWNFMRLIDLVGVSIVGDIEGWTSYQKNNKVLSLEGTFLINRLIWIAFTLAVVGYAFVRFEFKHHFEGTRWRFLRLKRQQIKIVNESAIKYPDVVAPLVLPAFGLFSQLRQMLSIASSSFGMIVRSKTGVAVVGLIALQYALFGYEHLKFRGVPQYASTMNILSFMTASLSDFKTPLVVIPMLIVFYAGELVWREREVGVNKIMDTVPVDEWVLLGGKYFGLVLTTIVWLGMLMLASVLIQVSIDDSPIYLSAYLQAFFVFQLSDYLFFSVLALTIHVLVDQKYLGHFVVLCVYLLIVFHGAIGIHHKLLVFGSDTGWSYTDMRGFEPYIQPWIWFTVYWAGWTLLLAVVARLLWVRSLYDTITSRISLMRQRLDKPTVLVIVAGCMTVATSGGFIFYNTNVLNAYKSSSDRTMDAVRYEKNYALYKNIAQPVLVASSLNVDLFPSKRRADVQGTYKIVNNTRETISTVHVTTHTSLETNSIVLSRPAEIVLEDDDLGYRIYNLQNALQPGDSMEMIFNVKFYSRGFTNDGISEDVITNGSYFINYRWLPAIGYQKNAELTSAPERKKYGLPAKSIPSVYDLAANKIESGQELIQFEAILSTETDQIAIAPGRLVRKWTDSSTRRSHFHYRTSSAIRNNYSFFSAKYAEQHTTWKSSEDADARGVDIRMYYHPDHQENVSEIIESAKASLSYYSEKFGPYPYDHLTIIERSGFAGELNAEPTTIDYGESFPMSNIKDNQWALNLIYFAIAHEVAHQWWGAAQLMPAHVEGGIILSETLANYSGMKVLEQRYGSAQVRSLLDMWRNSYEVPRIRYTPPLLQAIDAFLGYRKGPIALYALMQYSTPETINEVLRELIRKKGNGTLPLATSLDLYRELKKVTPDSIHYLLKDYFEQNIYWQLKISQAEAKKNDSGSWTVTINIDAKKVTVDSTGAEVSVAMDDYIEMGVYGAYDKKLKSQKTLYLKKHLIRSGQQTLTLTVPERPQRAGIDPNYLLIDLNPDNNSRGIKVEGEKADKMEII
jgi:ABC-2 type transport system permease protein